MIRTIALAAALFAALAVAPAAVGDTVSPNEVTWVTVPGGVAPNEVTWLGVPVGAQSGPNVTS